MRDVLVSGTASGGLRREGLLSVALGPADRQWHRRHHLDELDAPQAPDGSRTWRYAFPATESRLPTTNGNRIFLLHDSKAIAFNAF
ncbi:hypothetical protein OG407_36645 [Streptomyces sp. NBC_01515]|uniref:hypothetical protein n=1 Tax=Streptomyces sp. NBC_01515 TaxID=2903890 RepID=UPI0038648B9A